MSQEDEPITRSVFPPIPLSRLAMDLMAAIEKMHEYERIHGPISQRGPKTGKGRLTRRGIKK